MAKWRDRVCIFAMRLKKSTLVNSEMAKETDSGFRNIEMAILWLVIGKMMSL